MDKDSNCTYNYSFFAYLQHYVDVAKNAGVNIVLFTNFNRAETTTANMQGYPEAMIAFASERNVPVVDVTTSSTTMYNSAITAGAEKVTAGAIDTANNFARNLFLYVANNDARYTSNSAFASSKYYSGIKDAHITTNTVQQHTRSLRLWVFARCSIRCQDIQLLHSLRRMR